MTTAYNKRTYSLEFALANLGDGNYYGESFEIEREDIENLSLDKLSQSAPFTLQNENYTILENYLFDFWTSIIGKDAVLTFMYLKRHSNNSSIAEVGLKELCVYMGVGSVNTIKKYIRTLQEYGFLIMFKCHEKHDADGNRNTQSERESMFKLRKTIPMLNSQQVGSLHKKLIKMHDEFIEQHNIDMSNENQVAVAPSVEDVIADLISEKGKPTNQSQKSIAREVAKIGSVEFAKRIISVDDEFDKAMKERIKEYVSKPTYDMYERAVFIKQGMTISVLTLDTFWSVTIMRNEKFVREICAQLEQDTWASDFKVGVYTFHQLLIDKTIIN